MKTVTLSISSGLFMLCLFLSSFAKEQKLASNKEETLDKKKSVYCEVTCNRGSCKTEETSSSCTCLPFGIPDCAGKMSLESVPFQNWGVSVIVLEKPKDQIASYEQAIEYVNKKANSISNRDQKQLLLNFVSPLTKIKNLFIANDYQIKDKNEINKYYKSAKEIKKIFDQLPLQLQEDVMDEM